MHMKRWTGLGLGRSMWWPIFRAFHKKSTCTCLREPSPVSSIWPVRRRRRCVDEVHFVEVYEAGEYGAERLYQDGLCWRDLHAFPKAQRIHSLWSRFNLYDWDYTAAGTGMCSVGADVWSRSIYGEKQARRYAKVKFRAMDTVEIKMICICRLYQKNIFSRIRSCLISDTIWVPISVPACLPKWERDVTGYIWAENGGKSIHICFRTTARCGL